MLTVIFQVMKPCSLVGG